MQGMPQLYVCISAEPAAALEATLTILTGTNAWPHLLAICKCAMLSQARGWLGRTAGNDQLGYTPVV